MNILSVDHVNWQTWRPEQRATLLFVIREGKILLIHKKLGLGAGKINGPGGRIEPGETAKNAAVREVEEELLVTPLNVREAGDLHFQFADGFSLYGAVFTATDCKGNACETEEAIPLWIPLDAIPYDQMWADDRYWLPLLLQGTRFRGYFTFDSDRMLDYRIETD